jgi:hypothetical protein
LTTTYRVGREHGAEFFMEVAEHASEWDDPTPFIVTGAIGSDVFDGYVTPNERGHSAPREHLSRRPNVPRPARIPTRRGGGPPTPM